VCAEQAGDSEVMTGVYTAETAERWTLYQAESFDLDSNNNYRPPNLKQQLQSYFVVWRCDRPLYWICKSRIFK